MYPHERSLVKRLEGKPFALVGVNSDQDKAELKKTMAKENITWRSFWDGGNTQGPIATRWADQLFDLVFSEYRPPRTQGPIATRWAVQGWPTLYLIDHKGVIRHKHLGNPGDKVLDEEIDKLIKEVEDKK